MANEGVNPLKNIHRQTAVAADICAESWSFFNPGQEASESFIFLSAKISLEEEISYRMVR